MEEFSGIAASPGVAIGPALIYRRPALEGVKGAASGPASAELAKLDEALQRSRADLEQIKERAERELGASEAAIYDAHLLILDDPPIWEEVRARIAGGLSAPEAVRAVADHYAARFRELEDEYLRERGADLLDVADRVLRHLLGLAGPGLGALTDPVVVVARDLSPSETVTLDRTKVLALVTETGGPTSHASIVARALGIPAVVGVRDILSRIENGKELLVDGDAGRVVLEPDAREREAVAKREQEIRERQKEEAREAELPAQTLDGERVKLVANIGHPAESEAACRYGAEGVGLYRTEFLFMGRPAPPDEEEQYAAYATVVKRMAGRRVIIRTLDVGGDKPLAYLAMGAEANPFLGLRGLRLSLENPALFKVQLRALWRASHHGPLGVMFPMVSSLEEVELARRLLTEARDELRKEGVAVGSAVEVGVMIETPAAALMAAELAERVDFLSIGTNDLTQYTMAADRLNERVSHLYQPLHPAVLRLIRFVVEGAHRAGKWVGVCGELAGDPLATPLLLGLGLDELSMSPTFLPAVKRMVRSVRMAQARELAAAVLRSRTAEEVRQRLALRRA